MGLAPDEVATLYDKTEGWPIAVQLTWQGLRSGAARSVADLLAAGVTSSTALFDYLARETLDRQPPEIRAFLREMAVLGELTPEACDAVRDPVILSAAKNLPAETDQMLRSRRSLSMTGGGHSAARPTARRCWRGCTPSICSWSAGRRALSLSPPLPRFLAGTSATDVSGVQARHRRAGAFFQDAGDYDRGHPSLARARLRRGRERDRSRRGRRAARRPPQPGRGLDRRVAAAHCRRSPPPAGLSG